MTTDAIEQLRATEAIYRGMFDNAPQGIYQSTPDGHYLVVNVALARMYGYERPEELLNRVSDIQQQVYVDPSLREGFKQEIERSGFIHGSEYAVRRCDGKVIWISESARAVRDAAGKTLYYEGFITDITARKEAEAERTRLEKQMLHAQKMDAIGTLAGGIAHDFNNILCAILGYTELSLGDNQIRGLSRDNLTAVLHSALRGKELIKRILTFSRPSDPERRPLKLSVILDECSKMLNATLPSSIEISIQIHTDNDVIVADATEIHQVIMNLGTNAGHAMRKKGGRLEFDLSLVELNAAEIATLPAGKYVRLIARDNGHGMSREVLEKIFEPFFTTKSVSRGTGLGLTLVQKIVTRCGGHICVESFEGNGTVFQVYLPQSSQPPAPPKSQANQVLPGQREHILVVDDEIPVLSMMQQRLRQIGYRVVTRADSQDALETFRADPEKFSLVITDHTMPGLQGAELAERLGEIRSDIPVILVTGLNQPPEFTGSPFVTHRAVFQKPINFVELSHRLRSFLDDQNKNVSQAKTNGFS